MISLKSIFLTTTAFFWTRKVKVPLALLFLCLCFTLQGYAQCALYSNPGNNVISEPRTCAPNLFQWEITYSVRTGRAVQFLIDWGNGTDTISAPTNVGTAGMFTVYVDTVEYVYPKGGDDCNYLPTAYVIIDGVQCLNSDQSQSITVWDLDDENGGQPRIDPPLYRVCLGESATISFRDNSIWNCVPNSGENDRINDLGRWVQWIYGTGPAGNRIPNVEVNGAPRTYSFDGPVEYLPGPITAPNSQSYDIFVPATFNPADIGKEFEVQLRNWNICNPYDANLGDGNPLNPVDPNGDSAYIETEARIVIVKKSEPDFRTRLNNSAGAVKTEFCLGETIFFQDQTPSIPDANFKYEWKIYDDAAGTTLLRTQPGKNIAFSSFPTKGTKMISLTVRDENSVGQCGGTITKFIDILSVADAQITVTDELDQPLNSLCYDPANPTAFKVKFTDNSTDFDPATSQWQWNFYHHNGATYQNDSTKNGAGIQESYIATYTQPGSYMAVLTNTASNVDCTTQDTVFVHIYHKPAADFDALPVCLSDSTEFISTATIPTLVNNDDIAQYGWDFDYDGITFTPDTTTTEATPFKHKYDLPGTYQVAHQVITTKGNCSDMVVKDVEVKPIPIVTFQADQIIGCSPLKVNFTIDTPLSSQPVSINAYIWHVLNLKTGTENTFNVAPTAGTFNAPDFVNNQITAIDHLYEVWLEAVPGNGCPAISERIIITVFPGPTSEFNITNLLGTENNCSPRNYQFQVTAATQALIPDAYHWTILDESNQSVVVDQTISGMEPNFSYTLLNEGANTKKYRVRLIAERLGMCFSATEKIIFVNPVPSSAFSTTLIESDCQLMTFHVEAQQKGLNYDWTISPQPINSPDLSQSQFELVYDKKLGASYEVDISLKTTNMVDCESTETVDQMTIHPRELLDASFFVNPSILEIPSKTVSINNNTINSSWTYQWDFGDGTTSTEEIPGFHEYETYGEYWIKLTIHGQYCSVRDSAKVIIKQTLPQTDFEFVQLEDCQPLAVTFTNLSQYAEEDTYLWDFGDGATSTEINPSHTYASPGVYRISLKASNSLGIIVEKQKDFIVDFSQLPKAAFSTYGLGPFYPKQNVNFRNQSQNASSYFWDFGDGETSEEIEPVHQFEEPGTYDITLIIQNEIGCIDTLKQPFTIDPLIPIVDFTYEPPQGCRPLTVQFRNMSRYTDPKSYYWSFGEGEGFSTEENPTYTYYEAGIYTVTLEAKNSAGVKVTEMKEFSVEVFDNPIAGFKLRPEKTFLGENIYFANLSIGAKYYFWDFGDGNTSSEFEPVYQYNRPGAYDITLIVENEKGCVDTLKKENAIVVEEGGKIMVPNAFTPSTDGPGSVDPSGDSKNDVFLPIIEGITSYHLLIFNRWGELMFETYEKTYGWDGYYKGRLCPKDVYVYKLEIKFSDGRSETLVGDVTLIR